MCSVGKGNYIYSIDERLEYILNIFLFVDDPKLGDLEGDLEVSRTTIKKDMAALQEYLEKYDLHFEQEGNRISIRGNEKKLRHLIMLKMIRYIDGTERGFYPVENRIREIIEKKQRDLQIEADEILEKIEKKLREDFSKEFKRIIRYYLWVTLFRIEKGRYIVKKHNSNFLRKTHYYEVIRGIVKDYIDDELDYERLHLTEYLLSGSSDKEYYEERIAIELFTYELLKETGGRTGGGGL